MKDSSLVLLSGNYIPLSENQTSTANCFSRSPCRLMQNDLNNSWWNIISARQMTKVNELSRYNEW